MVVDEHETDGLYSIQETGTYKTLRHRGSSNGSLVERTMETLKMVEKIVNKASRKDSYEAVILEEAYLSRESCFHM